jgi:hypothetical protein
MFWLAWTMTLLIYASQIAEITGLYHCVELLLVEVESQELFAWAGLEL